MKKVITALLVATMCIGASCAKSTDNKNNQSIAIAFDVSKGCTPKESKANAGTFTIVAHNEGKKTGELEILDGDRIRGEAENILPKAEKKFSIKLEEGDYVVLCGKKNGKKAKLTVGSAVTPEKEATVDQKKLTQAVSDYKSYVLEQIALLEVSAHTLTDAVRAGDVQAARTAFGPSREPWERIEPIAELFAKYDSEIDSRVDDFEGVDDPLFTGFHRIEYGLFEKNSTEGLTPFADQLDQNILDLGKDVESLSLDPLDMAKGAQGLMEEISKGKITGEEDRYSHTDLYDFQANVDGSIKIVNLLRELLDGEDPTITKQFDTSIAQVNERLSTYKNPDGSWDSYEEVTEADRTQLKADIAALSEHLSQLPGTLGLS